MKDQITHCPLDQFLQFHSGAEQEKFLRVTDLALIIRDSEVLECRLIVEISPQLYSNLDKEGIFNLDPKIGTSLKDEGFAPDIPVEITAKLDQALLPLLLEQSSTVEEIATDLLKLSENDPKNILLSVDRWYGLYIKQTVPLPPELTGTGELKRVYKTHWAEENNIKSEKVIINLEENRKIVTTEQSILQTITDFFTKDGNPVYQWQSKTVISLPYKGSNGEWRCYADGRESQNLCCFYSICPIQAPEDKRMAIAEFIARVNYTLTVGNFEMDFDDGEIRYRTSIDVEDDRLSTPLFKQLTIANVTMMDLYLPAIRDIIENNVSPAEAIAAIES